MNRKEKLDWYKKEFDSIHKDIRDKEQLSLFDFLKIRNFKLQNSTTENEKKIQDITFRAFKLAKEDKIKEAITELIKLNGAAIPIASAILAMKFPERFAIIDKRVIKRLNRTEWIKDYQKNPFIYEEYILLMRKTKPQNSSLRDYERTLFE